MQLMTGLKMLAFGTVIVMASACRDGDGDLLLLQSGLGTEQSTDHKRHAAHQGARR